MDKLFNEIMKEESSSVLLFLDDVLRRSSLDQFIDSEGLNSAQCNSYVLLRFYNCSLM